MVYGEEGFIMCGRYLIATEQEVIEIREILNEINEKFGYDTKMKTGEIFPTDTAPVIANGTGGIWAQPMAWGFPSFRGSGVIINAKAETVFEKNMFRSSLLSRRCVVPSTGFYEWQQRDGEKRKDKYLIRFKNTPLLYMAGIYSLFRRQDGSEYPCFVILTTAANESVAAIHNRMPVILSPGEKDLWMNDKNCIDGILKREGPAVVPEKVS